MGFAGFIKGATNHLVDGDRIGNLFFNGHRYTAREVLMRAFVITTTAATGFLAWNQSGGDVLSSAGGASLGFFISHAIVIAPFVYKRLQMRWACDALKAEITSLLSEKSEVLSSVRLVIDKVLNYSESKSASGTWGRRERLLTNLKEWLIEQIKSETPDEQLMDILQSEDIMTKLDQNDFYSNSKGISPS